MKLCDNASLNKLLYSSELSSNLCPPQYTADFAASHRQKSGRLKKAH